MQKTSVLFVCLGNICRSPLAEVVFKAAVERRGLSKEIEVDSCGTGGWHVGEQADGRMRQTARRHGLDLEKHRARQLKPKDLGRFDWVVAMDRSNLRSIQSMAQTKGGNARIVAFMDYVGGDAGPDVPDPYYGGPSGFDRVHDILQRGAEPLLDAVTGSK